MTTASRLRAIENGRAGTGDVVLEYELTNRGNEDVWMPDDDAPSGYSLQEMTVWLEWEPTRSTPRPVGYLVPPSMAAGVPLLMDHDIAVYRFRDEARFDAEVYYATSVWTESYFQGHYLKAVEVEKEVEAVEVVPGWYWVPTAQPMGNLITYLMEPEPDPAPVLSRRQGRAAIPSGSEKGGRVGQGPVSSPLSVPSEGFDRIEQGAFVVRSRPVPSQLALPALFGVVLALAPAQGAIALPAASTPIPATMTAQAQDPFLAFRYDADANRLFLLVPEDRLGEAFLYQNTLATGTSQGGLDRGQLGRSGVMRLERQGARVVMIEENLRPRALSGDEELERTARESFPTSVVAVFPVEEEEGNRLVVDATSFFLADIYNVAGRLPGNYRLDRDRSWIREEDSAAFPRNTEIRSVMTYTLDTPGTGVTVQQHHSLVALPDAEGFRPRLADGRSGLFATSFLDFSQGFDGRNYREGYTARWRLIPSDPEAYLRGELVEPVEPIVYYMDPGIPEPYRTAFFEGGRWWNQIFEAAGFRDAFHVRDLPEGANPMDARYPMIYWVHRVDPAASVGPSFRDPRTGEIVNTVVRMDSHRSLVDYNIWAGLLPAAGAQGLDVDAEAFAMARRRQHTAHEIGHTIGIAHNFIAASQGRASVMDYPAPLIDLGADGRLDLSQAYRTSGGAWDSLAVAYAYTWFPDEESEREGLARILKEALDDGLRFITGGHAGQSGSIPEATQWVEGSTMFEALDRTTRVRRLLVDRFDERAIRPGEPMSLLNQRFAHVYLHHRYALEGVIKYVGGMDFTYAVRGDGQIPAQVLPAEEQRRAIELVLDALEPAELAIPAKVPGLIPPSGQGTDGSEIWIPTQAGTAFDRLTVAGGLATEIVENLLHRERAQRLVTFQTLDEANPSFDELLTRLVERSWGGMTPSDAYHRALRRVTQRVVANTIMDLAGDPQATSDVRAIAEHHLLLLEGRLTGAAETNTVEEEAHRAALLQDLARYFRGEDEPELRSRFPVVPLPWP